jgi:hypothetical protein
MAAEPSLHVQVGKVIFTEGVSSRRLDSVLRQDLDLAQVGDERLQGTAVVIATPRWTGKEGVDAPVHVVNFAQPDPRSTDPLEKGRDQPRLVAPRFLCVTGLGKGGKEPG